jgi:hypothetical protein
VCFGEDTSSRPLVALVGLISDMTKGRTVVVLAVKWIAGFLCVYPISFVHVRSMVPFARLARWSADFMLIEQPIDPRGKQDTRGSTPPTVGLRI